MKKIIYIFVLTLFLIPSLAQAGLAYDLKGMILLQVQEHGEAWYVYPDNQQRYYLGRPADAFDIMRELGLGIAHNELEQYLGSKFPSRLSGKIMLDVQMHGEAYYVYPKDLKGYYLGRPADAFEIMRQKGLGITNLDLTKINIASSSDQPVITQPTQPTQPNSSVPANNYFYSDIEKRVFDLVNQHRQSISSKTLIWSDAIADICRVHSQNMATGVIEPSHDGFAERMDQIELLIPEYNGGAENLAWNYNYADVAQAGFDWWLTSPGHRSSLEDNFYDMTGVGVAKNAENRYFITQIFINIE